jgi:hypothetical protein
MSEFQRRRFIVNFNDGTAEFNDNDTPPAEEYLSLSEHKALVQGAMMDEWAEMRRWKPFLHWCPDWDFLLVDRHDAEFEACHCFKNKPSQIVTEKEK